tara:strand:+ start:2997 stop:3155 length:159 start_codon:yes stop_codon:yes gene_type:complete
MDWEKPFIFKELTEVYIVNHKKFFTKEEAECYLRNLELKEIESRIDFASEAI